MLRESMNSAVGVAGRGWLPVRCPHPRPVALAVHMGTVPLATILRVFRLVPGHQGGGRGRGGRRAGEVGGYERWPEGGIRGVGEVGGVGGRGGRGSGEVRGVGGVGEVGEEGEVGGI